MSEHYKDLAGQWPEFEQREDNLVYPKNIEMIWYGNHVNFALVPEHQYNHAKMRIDACAGMIDPPLTIKTLLDNLVAADENIETLEADRDALQQRCEELVDIAHECQKIIKELCACYSHHEPIATLERIEAIKQVQP